MVLLAFEFGGAGAGAIMVPTGLASYTLVFDAGSIWPAVLANGLIGSCLASPMHS
jgi:hypothetical protein